MRWQGFTEVTGFGRGDGVLCLSKNNRRWTDIYSSYYCYWNDAADEDINTDLGGVGSNAPFITVNEQSKSNPDCKSQLTFM